MGSYIYKVTGKKVRIEGGLEAHIALYAYKPYWRSETNDHLLSGAAACDRAAAAGKRSGWVVEGYKRDDGTIAIGPVAYELGARCGSYNDDAVAYEISKGRCAARDVISVPKGVKIVA